VRLLDHDEKNAATAATVETEISTVKLLLGLAEGVQTRAQRRRHRHEKARLSPPLGDANVILSSLKSMQFIGIRGFPQRQPVVQRNIKRGLHPFRFLLNIPDSRWISASVSSGFSPPCPALIQNSPADWHPYDQARTASPMIMANIFNSKIAVLRPTTLPVLFLVGRPQSMYSKRLRLSLMSRRANDTSWLATQKRQPTSSRPDQRSRGVSGGFRSAAPEISAPNYPAPSSRDCRRGSFLHLGFGSQCPCLIVSPDYPSR